MREMRYSAITERTIIFRLPDGFKAKGVLRGNLNGPVAVMVHGRPGNGNELLQYLGARYLHGHGIATLRLFLYDFAPGARSLMDCTLATHAGDFEAVVAQLRRRAAGPIFAVGHSYGGLVILKSAVQLDGAVLWDPSHGLWWAEDRGARYAGQFPETIAGAYVVGTAGSGWVYPAAALAYDKQLGDTSTLAAKRYPLKIISAGNGGLADLGKRYFEAANEPKSYIAINGAGHGFDESDEIMLKLFEETAAWLMPLSSAIHGANPPQIAGDAGAAPSPQL